MIYEYKEVANRSSTAKVSLWEEHVNALKEHKSFYSFKNHIMYLSEIILIYANAERQYSHNSHCKAYL